MEVRNLPVKDACVITFPRYRDHRGFLNEIYNELKYPPHIKENMPVRQNTMSMSKKNVIRGLHISTYCKLLTCIKGSVYDVVVDLRPDSPTYLQWAGAVLTAENCKELYIPPNCGHGFLSLEEDSTVVYAQGGCFTTQTDKGINPFDPVVNVDWPLGEGVSPILSEKDEKAAAWDMGSSSVQPKRHRILIVGASGQVGGAIMEAIGKQSDKFIGIGTCNEHPRDNHISFDMEKAAGDVSESEFLLATCRPHTVVICAAFSWVDGNEKFPEKAENINVKAVVNLSKAARDIGAKVVFYSSDYVFDGKLSSPAENGSENKTGVYDTFVGYTEDSQVNPLCAYGKMKVKGEEIVLNSDPRNLVLRVSRVFGPEEIGKNFVYQVTNNCKEQKPMKLLENEVSCPTYNRDIAQATLQLIEKGSAGLFHCVGPRAYSKYCWGTAICDILGLESSNLESVSTLPSVTIRPDWVPLSNNHIRNELPGFKFHNLEEALADWKAAPRGKPL